MIYGFSHFFFVFFIYQDRNFWLSLDFSQPLPTRANQMLLHVHTCCISLNATAAWAIWALSLWRVPWKTKISPFNLYCILNLNIKSIFGSYLPDVSTCLFCFHLLPLQLHLSENSAYKSNCLKNYDLIWHFLSLRFNHQEKRSTIILLIFKF